jgi:thiol-disulfide isomerase/thioredoxin
MKKVLFAAILFISITVAKAQVKFDALQVTPQMPKAGQTVSFKFNSKFSSLIDEKKVDILVYLFSKNGYKVEEPKIVQSGSVYSGSVKLDTATSCIAFGFSANDAKAKDNNAGDGYIVPVYGKNNQPVTEYYLWAGRMYTGYGEQLFGMKTVTEKNLSLLEDGLKLNPDAKDNMDYFSTYLRAVNTVKKKEGEQIILAHLKNIESKPDIKEADYNILSQWYKNLKMKSMADSFSRIMKEKYPDGAWKKNELLVAIYNSKDAETKKAAYDKYINTFPPKQEDDNRVINDFKNIIANAYHKEKNYDAFKIWSKGMSMADKASMYNNQSWNMALAKEDLAYAKQISYEATAWAKKQMTTPTEKKPDYLSKKDWAKQRENQYGMYADTYSLILYETGDYKNGYQYAKESAIINEFKNAEYNERYTQLLVKVMPPATAKKEIEKFVKDGVASSKTKELLKELYVAEKKSDKGYDGYLAKLEMAAKEKKREELAKTMINEEAPKFSLKDFEGNDISLAGLKGKVVIADFWATWCGPCIASMPAMKKAQEKLTANGDVAFVFIDTWESAENKKQNAEDFMTKNKYPFHVLMDNDDKVVADFKVNGIPTKFVIDKTGNIRFKSVGFSGNDDALVDEISMMVEMASADMPVRNYVK